MTSVFAKIHNRLIPADEPMRFAPYLWLAYLSIFIVGLYFYQSTPNYLWQVIVGLTAFLAVYFHAYHASPKVVLIDIVLILAIGTWMTTINPGASVFFVYAAAFVCRVNSARMAFILLITIVAFVGLISWIFNFHAAFYIPAVMFSLMIGGLNIFQHEMEIKRREIQLSKQELKTLAATAERERIARDLHDVIGHTFSLLTRKAELAGRLIEKDTTLATNEIKEIEAISRDALQQVREVISGYRSGDLVSELAHAKYVLESNDIAFDYELQLESLSDSKSKEIAVIVKELVTNVLKHANATQVHASIKQLNERIVLLFADNGQGLDHKPAEGFGLQGINERLAALNGQAEFNPEELMLYHEMNIGFAVRIEVPVND